MSSINRDVDDFKIVITCPHCNHSAEMSSGPAGATASQTSKRWAR